MKEKILIIDDSQTDAKIIKHYLKKNGYDDILWDETGKKGIKTAREKKPSVVIIDIIMPDIDGFRICSELSHLKKDGTKLILTTAALEAANALKARNSGADDFVLKEPDCHYLLKSVKEALEQTQRAKLFDTVLEALRKGDIKEGANKQAIKTEYPGALELDDGSLLYLCLTTEQNLYVRLYFENDSLTNWKQRNHSDRI